ncbi:MAG: LicD family protein [Flavobacteriaceae bacterium]
MSAKLRVIGFGIGTSCKDYLKNYKDEYEIVALSDWDSKTHGTEKYNYQVINPYDFDKYDFDKILILSFYVNEIKEQLAEKLNIKDESIVVPEKHKIKGVLLPFIDEKTKEFGRSCLIYFSELMQKNNIRGFLDYGALLGLVRDGDIIDWDDDIDFSVFSDDAEKLKNLLLFYKEKLPEHQYLDWSCKISEDKDGNIWYFSLNFTNKNEFIYREFEIAVTVRMFYKGHAIKMRNDYQSAPEEFFKSFEFITFRESKILVPYRHIDYLDFYYKNWQTPERLTFGTKYGISYQGGLDEIKVQTREVLLF